MPTRPGGGGCWPGVPAGRVRRPNRPSCGAPWCGLARRSVAGCTPWGRRPGRNLFRTMQARDGPGSTPARRPGPGRANPGRDPGLAAVPTHPRRAAEPGNRSPRTLADAHHQPQGPQTAAAHPDRRRQLAPETDSAQARVGIRWHTGATDELVITRPLPSGPAKRSPSPAVELARQLGPSTATRDLVDKLNAAGKRPDHGGVCALGQWSTSGHRGQAGAARRQIVWPCRRNSWWARCRAGTVSVSWLLARAWACR